MLPFREPRALPSNKTLKVCKSGMRMLLLEKWCFSCSTKSLAKLTCGYTPTSGASSWTKLTKLDDTGRCWRNDQSSIVGKRTSTPTVLSVFDPRLKTRPIRTEPRYSEISRKRTALGYNQAASLHSPDTPLNDCRVSEASHLAWTSNLPRE